MCKFQKGLTLQYQHPSQRDSMLAFALSLRTDSALTAAQRYLKTIPVVAFGITLTASWEATANGFQAGLLNGGPASLVWGFLVAGPGTLMIVLSLAEMASMFVLSQACSGMVQY